MCHATLADTPSAARAIQEIAPVQAGQACRDLPAGRSGFPARELVELAQRTGDVLVGDEPVLGVSRRVVIACPRVGLGQVLPGIARQTRERGEPLPGRGRRLRQGSVEKLLHLRLRPQCRFLVPGSDRPHADSQMGGKCLVA